MIGRRRGASRCAAEIGIARVCGRNTRPSPVRRRDIPGPRRARDRGGANPHANTHADTHAILPSPGGWCALAPGIMAGYALLRLAMTAVDETIDADVDAVPVGEQRTRDGATVEQRAVAAAQILNDDILLANQQHRMLARDRQVIEHQHIGGTPADGGSGLGEPVGAQRAACHRQ